MYISSHTSVRTLLEKDQKLLCIHLKLNVNTTFQIQLTCQNWLAKTQGKHHSGTAALGLTVGKIHLEAYIYKKKK